MEELIYFIVRQLVDKTDAVQLRSVVNDMGVFYELQVAQEDTGKVIGRDGRTINAIRAVVAAAGQKKQVKVRLELFDTRRAANSNVNVAEQPVASAPALVEAT